MKKGSREPGYQRSNLESEPEIAEMKLYLIRHGKTLSKEEDPKRALSEAGQVEINKLAQFLARQQDVGVKVVLHSGKRRAEQTAEIIAGKMSSEPRVMEANNLEPNADVEVWLDRARVMEESAMVVGHLPHIASLTSRLLHPDAQEEFIEFATGTTACLARAEDGTWRLEWLIDPRLLD
jgi:phosphohistidine phosphatase